MLILTLPFCHSIGIGEGMGSTFSISLPMQRIPQHVLDTIENSTAFGRYANPAVSRRLSHDLIRSSFSQKNESLKSSINQQSATPDLTDNVSGTNANLLLQSGPDLTIAGGGSLCLNNIDTDVILTTEHTTKSLSLSSRSYQQSSGRTLLDDVEKYHILIVDDSQLNRKMLSKLLKSKGHAIEEAADGQKCIDKVKQEADAGRSFDVILMDFVMPVMDGPTATRAIRAMHIRTPIFGVTGNYELHNTVYKLYL